MKTKAHKAKMVVRETLKKSPIFRDALKYWRIKSINQGIDHIKNKCQLPIFSSIEIETINRCNGICAFCPVNRNIDKRKYVKMNGELFKKILNDLKEIEYEGKIALYSNNEPFLDERIEHFAKIAKETLPKANIAIATNGSLLTLDRFKNIIPHLDQMLIDNYNDDLKLNPTNKIIYDYCKNDDTLNKKVRIDLIKTNIVRGTRGGQSPNNSKKEILPTSCLIPWSQLIVRPDGKISLCCQDALGKYTLGDLTQQTIQEVWTSEEYEEIRSMLKNGGRKMIELCKYCDHGAVYGEW